MSKVMCRECGGNVSVTGDPNKGAITYGVCHICKGKAQMRKMEEDRRRREEQRLDEQRHRETQRNEERRHKELVNSERLSSAKISSQNYVYSDDDSYNDESEEYGHEEENDEEPGERSLAGRSYSEPPKKQGCLGCIFKLFGLLIVCFLALVILGYFIDKGDSGSTKKDADGASSMAEPMIEKSKDPKVSPGKSGANSRGTDSIPETDLSDGSIVSRIQPSSPFEGKHFPLYVTVTDRVELLNKEGKETIITSGSSIRIDKRSESGTLTLYLNNELYVGNESRLIGKVQIRGTSK